jgi:hypothetical protein
MNDVPKRKPGRPRKQNGPVDRHIKIDRDLFDAINRPGCNLSNAVSRALRMYLKMEQPDNLKALAIRIRTIKTDMARLNRELSDARTQAVALGVKDMEEFEDTLDAW